MIIDRLILTRVESNAYIVSGERQREAMVIDPGDDAARICRRLNDLNLHLKLVVITHAHWDHVNAAGVLSTRYDVPVAMHPADAPLLSVVPDVTRDRTGTPGPPPPSVGRALVDGDVLLIDGQVFKVLHTPGHTPSSICLFGNGILFSGDTLMAGWVGRTDVPGGNQEAIRSSLWERILRLPDDTVVYAGHLEPTTLGAERRDNPYLNGRLPLR